MLNEHSLRFHKVSTRDGSGKCDAYFTENPADYIIGALYEISAREKAALDTIEGLGFGYQEKAVVVRDEQGNAFEAVTYYATHTDPSLQPYSWYLYHVVFGARETGAPASYLEMPEATNSWEDADKAREARERAIYRQEG